MRRQIQISLAWVNLTSNTYESASRSRLLNGMLKWQAQQWQLSDQSGIAESCARIRLTRIRWRYWRRGNVRGTQARQTAGGVRGLQVFNNRTRDVGLGCLCSLLILSCLNHEFYLSQLLWKQVLLEGNKASYLYPHELEPVQLKHRWIPSSRNLPVQIPALASLRRSLIYREW